MAKKKTYKRAKGKKKSVFVLNVTNLKFVGAAIDEAISDLKMIKVTARDKGAVDEKIAELEDLHDRTSRLCPQSWWIPFETQ